MLSSMTGYGKASCRVGNKTATIEVRSLNSKNLDLHIKIPNYPKDKELQLRNHLAQVLDRGKVEVSFSAEYLDVSSAVSLNKDLFAKIYSEIRSSLQEVDAPVNSDIVPAILRLPDVLTSDTLAKDPRDWDTIDEAIHLAVDDAISFRVAEGQNLAEELEKRCKAISNLLKDIAPLEENRIAVLKAKLLKSLSDLQDNIAIDHNRLEQELIYYLEKLDITEEKVRLANHLSYFVSTMHNESKQGRKLGFIAQEIGREINTIGSKASDSEIQKIVVQMKDELEKIKEQLSNIL